MSEYAGICMSVPKSAWKALALHFSIVIPFLLECVLTYFNVYTKVEVTGSFFEETKFDFCL